VDDLVAVAAQRAEVGLIQPRPAVVDWHDVVRDACHHDPALLLASAAQRVTHQEPLPDALPPAVVAALVRSPAQVCPPGVLWRVLRAIGVGCQGIASRVAAEAR